MKIFLRKYLFSFLLTGVFVSSGLSTITAQNKDKTTADSQSDEKSIYERIWDVPSLYEGDNKVIQEFSIIGRYHGQYWNVNEGEEKDAGWENRRIYLGAEAKLFHNFTLQLQIKISEDFSPFYDGFYQAFVKWTPSKAFTLSTGRLDFLFAGLERTVSSTRIITFERGLLTNQLLPHEVVGALAQGNSGSLAWHAGVFSGNIGNELSDFSAGYGVVAGLGYRLPLFFSEGSLHLDYLYNNRNPGNNAMEPYDHILTLWHQGKSGPFSLGMELIAAHGIEGRKPVAGLTLMPAFVLGKSLILRGDALEVVLRYQYASSNGSNGLILQQRYEQKIIPGGAGDKYNAGYLGLNWLIYENRLKIMTGVEYSGMKDSAGDGGSFSGLTYMAGVRIFF